MPQFQTEGDYVAILEFENGAPATIVFNGYGYFNITDLTWGITEGGMVSGGGYHKQAQPSGPVDPADFYARPRRERESATPRERKQPIYGLTVVSCERGDMRQSPDGVFLYTDDGCEEITCPPFLDKAYELQLLHQAINSGTTVFPEGRWGRATLELLLAVLQSAEERREITLTHQVAAPD